MMVAVEAFAQMNKACPSCGSDAEVFEIRAGSFCPIVGVCLTCAQVWHILRQTHAEKHFQQVKKYVVDGAVVQG